MEEVFGEIVGKPDGVKEMFKEIVGRPDGVEEMFGYFVGNPDDIVGTDVTLALGLGERDGLGSPDEAGLDGNPREEMFSEIVGNPEDADALD